MEHLLHVTPHCEYGLRNRSLAFWMMATGVFSQGTQVLKDCEECLDVESLMMLGVLMSLLSGLGILELGTSP
jgi:hypothetical protein